MGIDWKEAKKHPNHTKKHSREGAVIVVVPVRNEKNVGLVYLDEIGDVRTAEIPRDKLPEVMTQVASGALGPVGLVSLGIATPRPPPPPPGPIGDEALYAAKLHAIAGVEVLSQLAALQVSFEQGPG